MTQAPEVGPSDRGRLVALTGPSGVGKGTVIARIRADHPQIWLSISVTTRRPRPGESDGSPYYFVDDAEFSRMVEAGEFLEHAVYAGHRYGTPRKPVEERLARGENALVEVELQGARQIRAAFPNSFLIFLAPPSWEELVRRLVGRGTEAASEVDRRLRIARDELAAEPEFDAVVVNDDVGSVAARVVALMINSPG